MSDDPSPFCECQTAADCPLKIDGVRFEMCRGTRADMPRHRQRDYRRAWFGKAGLAEPAPPRQPCHDCGVLAKIKAGVGIVRAALGLNATPRDILVLRLNECDTCPENDLGQCAVCGCYVAAKARVASETCPKNRWGPL